MKPYCDHPHCVRQFTHEHAPEAPDTPSGASLSDAEPVSNPVGPRNGRKAQERSVEEVGRDLVERARAKRERTPAAEPKPANGGATPEVETGDGPDGSRFAGEWEALTVELATLEAKQGRLQQDRKALIGRMRKAGMSYGQIAEVTGLSRQRVAQLAE